MGDAGLVSSRARWYGFCASMLAGAGRSSTPVAFVGVENCSVGQCFNAENLCGKYKKPCVNIGSVEAGVPVWVSMTFEFRSDYTYRSSERAAFSEESCTAGDAWLEIENLGRWSERGGNTVVN